jgi:lipid-binding SYLF domain-containing protein
MYRSCLYVLTIVLIAACTTTSGSGTADPAAKRRAIDAQVDGAMAKLLKEVPSSRELVGRARGILVFPSIKSAGFVVGGSYGEGALRTRTATLGYYNTVAGSVGLLAGADSKAVFVLFMTEDALNKFRNSNGWTAGADASVTLVKVGADAGVDSQTASQAVVGYVLSNAGLMANLSLDGTKVSRLDL